MIKLSSAYGGKWRAAFGQRELRFNKSIWTVVSEFHAPDDTFFSLIDQSDGSSFLFRLESLEDIAEIPEQALVKALADSIAQPKFAAVQVGESELDISGQRFLKATYHINNPKFGPQVLVHAVAKGSDDCVILRMIWPRDLPVNANGMPVKFAALISGLQL
jgi:hypothetical protein